MLSVCPLWGAWQGGLSCPAVSLATVRCCGRLTAAAGVWVLRRAAEGVPPGWAGRECCVVGGFP